MITSLPTYISTRAGRLAAGDWLAHAAIAKLSGVTGVRRVTRYGSSRFLPEFTDIGLLVLVSNTDCVQEFDDMIQLRLETCYPADYFESSGTCKAWRTGDLHFTVTCDFAWYLSRKLADDIFFSRGLAETQRREAGTPQPLPDLAYRSFGNTN